jgi:hypothetical protein
MKTLQQIHSRGLGPYSIPLWLDALVGVHERGVLASRDACHYQHNLNKDCDFFVSDDCVTYYSPTAGHFTIDTKARKIVA